MSFDWQTDEREWEDDLPQKRKALRPEPQLADSPAGGDAPHNATTHPRRRLRTAGLLAALALALLAVLYWQIDRRTRAVEERLTAEILASQTTILEAAQRADPELFVGFLSGRDGEWATSLEWLVRRGRYLDRSVFDLSLVNATPMTPTVTLAPDLRSAELVAPRAYALDVGNGLTETVTLEQTLVFRMGPDRWLLSPPEDIFWGEERMIGGQYVRVSYPARDADVVEPLARDVDAAVSQFCHSLGEECPQLHLTLSANPASFVAYDRPESAWAGGSEIVMPTPSLFGRPRDDAGRRALSRVYSARLVSVAAANFSGWHCCDDALFYGALLDAQLYRLGLRPWPVGTADYANLAQRPEQLRAVEGLWQHQAATAEERRLVYTLVDFLVTQSTIPIPYIQRMLLNDFDMPYWAWLTRATNGIYGSQTDFERALLRHAAEQVPASSLSGG